MTTTRPNPPRDLRRMTRRQLLDLAFTGKRQILHPDPATCTKAELRDLLTAGSEVES